MALRVIIDGKPCAGKTTVSKSVEEKLTDEGIETLDAKTYAMEKGFLSGFLRKFREGEIDSLRTLLHSAVYHTTSYIALEHSAWINDKDYEVVLLQRSPYAFSFMVEAAKAAFGSERAYKDPRALYAIIKAWSSAVKPDLFIYLTTDVETLRERFDIRRDGRDRVHKKMIEQDDSVYTARLRSYMRDSNFYMLDNTSSLCETTDKIASIIIDKLNERLSSLQAQNQPTQHSKA